MVSRGSLFGRTFAAFLGSLTVLLVVLALALTAGYRRSLSDWSERRVRAVEEAALAILSGRPAAEQPIPQDIPVFIYDTDLNLVASNRGVGRQRDLEHASLRPVTVDGLLMGHYSVGSIQFRNDAANRALALSLVRAALAGSGTAFVLAALAAFAFARSLSKPAARVAAGIDGIAAGAITERMPEEGAEEIARIARAANTLAARLCDERSLRAQWAQDVTHDLRTPIASIRSQLEAIVDGVYKPEPARIQSTLAELARVEHLINDLDDLMRLEAPEIVLSARSISAREFVSTLLQRFEHDAGRRALQFSTHVAVQTLHADETLLYRAVSNLVANAVRYASQGGRVQVVVGSGAPPTTWIEAAGEGHGEGAQPNGRAVQAAPAGAGRAVSATSDTPAVSATSTAPAVFIQVRNDGPPISADELPRLFERLYRAEYARHTPGSGLGLTIAQRIAQLHGGSIAMHSALESGNAVTIVLPPHSRKLHLPSTGGPSASGRLQAYH